VCSGTAYPDNTYTLPNEVVSTSPQQVDFFVLHGGTSGTTTFTLSRNGLAYQLRVTRGGEIEDLGVSGTLNPIASTVPSAAPSTAPSASASPSPSAVSQPSLSPSPEPSRQPLPSTSGVPKPSSGPIIDPGDPDEPVIM
jgi:hypothetical protein